MPLAAPPCARQGLSEGSPSPGRLQAGPAPPPTAPRAPAGLYLHCLVSRLRGTHLGLIQRLLDAGASVEEREPEQQAPLLHRVRHGCGVGGLVRRPGP